MSAVFTLNEVGSAALVAVRAAEARLLNVTVVFVDEHAIPVHLVRMPGARALSVDLATRKAETSARTGRATHEWAELLRADEDLARAALSSLPGLVLFGGGIPLRRDGEVIGAVGVSGAAQDDDQRLAALAAETLL